MDKLGCPWCGSTNKEHADFCPDSASTRGQTIGLPAYMTPPRVTKEEIETKESKDDAE